MGQKHHILLAALLPLTALYTPAAFASSRLQEAEKKPYFDNSNPYECPVDPETGRKKCVFMPQADAFETAAEQAVFLGAYQMSFGPYGRIQDPKERDELIKKTAVAIDDCVNNRSCGEEKQKLVLKSLVQFNLGQDIKRMMLTNQTNRERMRSLEGSGLSRSQHQNSMSQGQKFTYDISKKMEPVKRAEKDSVPHSTGSSKAPYFQLEESLVRRTLDGNFLKEREILGDDFIREYGIFIDHYTKAKDTDQGRFYKYVPARETHVYDLSRGGPQVVTRYDEFRREQQAREVQKAAKAYRESLRHAKIKGKTGDDGRAHIIAEGFDPEKDVGLGQITQIDPKVLATIPEYKDVNVNDLLVDGKLEGVQNARAVTRIVNHSIRRAAEEKLKGGDDRKPANTYVNVVLSPDKFDQFLDEIWPSAAQRKAIINKP